MNLLALVSAICCLWTAQATPSHFGGGGGGIEYQLQGIPDQYSYDKLTYPHLDIQDLGTDSDSELPPQIVTIVKNIHTKVPSPYPVKVPHGVPYPVPVAKPYPVSVPQFIKVPQPIPVEVERKVPLPVEVPKPYPVPSEEYTRTQGFSGHGEGQGLSAGGGFQPSAGYGVEESGQSESYQWNSFGSGQGYGGQAGDHEQEDQSGAYASVAASSAAQNREYGVQNIQNIEQDQQH